MENLDRYVHKQESLAFWDKTASGGGITYEPFVANGTYIYCKRDGKRTKPAQLTPKYGTTSRFDKEKRYVINEGLFVKKDYKGNVSEKRQFPFRLPGWVQGDRLMSTMNPNEMVKILHNKAIAKIMDGSGQLAVDLIQLNKTRTMVRDAILALIQGWKDLRRGQPFHTFVKTMKKEGWDGLLGRKWLEYVYGWEVTIEGAFETADTLSQDWVNQKVYVDGVSATRGGMPIKMNSYDNYWSLEGASTMRGKAKYQLRISDPKLALMKHLGLTNPASIAWELVPWSFVFDWAFRFGSYVDQLDWALGKSDIYIQCSVTRHASVIAKANPGYYSGYTKLEDSIAMLEMFRHERLSPTNFITPSWKGIKDPFDVTNREKRLAVALALLNQLRRRIGAVK